MDEVLTRDEIDRRFTSEWVLIDEPQTNEHLKVIAGKVVFHSHDRDEVSKKATEILSPRIAAFFTGPFPEDIVFAL